MQEPFRARSGFGTLWLKGRFHIARIAIIAAIDGWLRRRGGLSGTARNQLLSTGVAGPSHKSRSSLKGDDSPSVSRLLGFCASLWFNCRRRGRRLHRCCGAGFPD